MSDHKPQFPTRGRPRSRSSSRRFSPSSSRPQLQSLSAPPSTSDSMIYSHSSPTVESRSQYLHYPPPQPHYPPHPSYLTPYASQPMVTSAYTYNVRPSIDMQGMMNLPAYMHPQPDASSSNSSSSHPVPFPQHGHVSPPPAMSGPPHLSNTTGYHPTSYSSHLPTHFVYPSTQSYQNHNYHSPYLHPPFYLPYQVDQDNQWWNSSQYNNSQYMHQHHYHIQYPPQQLLPAERYQQHPQSSTSSDVQAQSPLVSHPPVRNTPTQPQSQPITITSPSPLSSPQKSDSPAKSPVPQNTDKEPTRQPYHPNPPLQRSEWVMWAGNVPSDTNEEELWKFFNKPPDSSDRSREETAGVMSIFLIARSNCAFVNFDTEAHLNAAIPRFGGQKFRPGDPKCPNLVCRVRKKTDDLRAGVGGQRGVGLHTRWVKEQKQKGKMGPKDDTTLDMSNLSLTSDEDGSRGGGGNCSFEQSSGSGSFASTTSSILTRYFPKRYFILKSLTQVGIYTRISVV